MDMINNSYHKYLYKSGVYKSNLRIKTRPKHFSNRQPFHCIITFDYVKSGKHQLSHEEKNGYLLNNIIGKTEHNV